MADSIPAVLARLAGAGVFVQWRGDKAVFRAQAEPPPDIVELIDSRKADVSAFLDPEAVKRRLDASADLLQAPRPPDVSGDRWASAIEGLRSFLADGFGAEAGRLGWTHSELYHVPKLWSRVWLCGVGLMLAEREVIEITADAITVKTPLGSVQVFRRTPAPTAPYRRLDAWLEERVADLLRREENARKP